MKNTQNTINLDSILFYSGDFAEQAAAATANREYGTYIEGLGYLRSTNDGGSYWTSYSDVVYREKTPTFYSLNDLYAETHSYMTANTNYNYPRGNVEIDSNKYTAIYSYESTLGNLFENSKIFPKDDLQEFLLGLNKQAFNKQNYYNGKPEISSIKLGYSYFDWYTTSDPFYFEGEGEETRTYTYAYDYYYFDANESNKVFLLDEEKIEYPKIFVLDENNTLVEKVLTNEQSDENPYLHYFSYSYSYDYSYYNKGVPVYPDVDNYYSYFRHEYIPINNTLKEYINSELAIFENKYSSNENIYSYHMYDCIANVPVQLSSFSLGLKNSTFRIRFDSEFNSWYTYYIGISANVNTDDILYKITSGVNDAIFSVIDENENNISTVQNITLNKDRSTEFISNTDLTIDNTIHILTPYKIDTLDLSPITNKLGDVLELNREKWVENKKSVMKSFILGSESFESTVKKINGLNDITSLEYIDIRNVNSLEVTPSLNKLENLKVFEASGSNIESFRPLKDTTLYKVSLPETIKSIKLMGNKFEAGNLTVSGINQRFTGDFDYTPSDTLNSLVLKDIDNTLSYRLFKDWYDACKTNINDLLSFNYLELTNINWKSVPVENLLALKLFDTNPAINGEISVIGSGNYKWLTRDEYQNIIKEFGINVFESRAISNRVFKDLKVIPPRKTETFEFDLTVENISVQKFNALENEYRSTLNEVTLREYIVENYNKGLEKIIYPESLAVSFGEYEEGTGYEILGNKIYNRAANAFLDLVYHNTDKEKEFKFKINRHAGNIYCKLPTSLDTYYSKEINNIKAGDILLFNGDTIMIFFKDVENSIFEYVKLGQLEPTDLEKIMVGYNPLKPYQTVEHWYDSYLCEKDENNEEYITLKFKGSEREQVIQEITVTSNGEDGNILYDNNPDRFLLLTVDIDSNAKLNYSSIQNTELKYSVYNGLMLEEVTEGPEGTYPRVFKLKPIGSQFIPGDYTVSFWCDANKEDTLNEFAVRLRIKFPPSQYDADNNMLILNDYYTVDGTTLVVSSEAITTTVIDTTINMN